MYRGGGATMRYPPKREAAAGRGGGAASFLEGKGYASFPPEPDKLNWLIRNGQGVMPAEEKNSWTYWLVENDIKLPGEGGYYL